MLDIFESYPFLAYFSCTDNNFKILTLFFRVSTKARHSRYKYKYVDNDHGQLIFLQQLSSGCVVLASNSSVGCSFPSGSKLIAVLHFLKLAA